MPKRQAGSELNHDNWNAEEEKEDPGIFVPLGGEALQNRVIKRAKRSLENSGGSSVAKSPFAAFSGFASSYSSQSPFSFLKRGSSADGEKQVSTDLKKTQEKENGNSTVSQEEKSEESQTGSEKVIDSSRTSPSNNSNISTKEKPTRSIEYYRQLQSLNESVLKWMQLHLAKNSCCDFTPVFNDYKKHLETLNLTYPIHRKKESTVSEDKNSGLFKKPAAPSNDSPSSMKTSSFGSTGAHSTFKFGNSVKKDETDYGAHFKSNTTNTSTFSFGIKSSPTATSSSSPAGPTTSLKGEEGAEEKKPFQFSFNLKNNSNSLQPNKSFFFAAASGETVDTNATEEQEYVPPKNEVVAVTEEGAVYSKRCKLFFKKDDNYAEKGIGTLYLKPIDGKTQLLIRADTNLGNILLNIMLSASLPMSRTGKNNVLIVCIPNPPVDIKNPDSKEAIPILIRV
ncbi:Nuclear pore complex protein Nup50, partial [Stegodyphus mimosarum]